MRNLKIRTKILITMAVMMTILAVVLTYQSYQKLNSAFQAQVTVENRQGTAVLAYLLRTSIPGVRIDADAENVTEARITWRNPPTDIDPRLAEVAKELTGLDNTVFAFDPETQDFVRLVSTITHPDGTSITGSTLARGAPYEALLRGETANLIGLVEGVESLVHYRPIFERDGTNVTGAIAMSRDYFAYQAELSTASSVEAKILIAAGILLITLIVSFLIMRRLLAPLTEVTGAIVNLSQGDLTGDIRHTNRTDEIGNVASSLLVLQESMQKADDLKTAEMERLEQEAEKQRDLSLVVEALTSGLARLSELDITTRIGDTPDAPFPAEYEALRASYNTLVDRLSATIREIRLTADEVTSDARELAGSSADLSDRTESQAATLQQSAAALEQLSTSVQSTAENAADAEATTNENRNAAAQTGEIVTNAIAAMEAIENSSKQITQIISVIDDIAFQTNLLALNAGVEAARAGDAGRGFAVVASEVRALAQHSSASAQQIKTLIAASSDQVAQGSTLVRDAGTALSDITARVERVAGLVSDIAVSAREQSVGVSEINDGVRDLDQATQRNAAMAEEASAATEGLTNAAERMSARLAEFKAGEGDHSPGDETNSVVHMPTSRSTDVRRTASQLPPEPRDAFAGF